MNPDTRKLEIAKCINAVAAYFGVSAKALYVSRYSKNKLHLKARVLIWYHLHKSGMSYSEIASEFNLGYDNVQKNTKQGSALLTEEDMMLMKTLPTIETTLKITPAIV